MDKDKILDDIFNNDPLGLLVVKPKTLNVKTAEERLLASFQEINDFIFANNREPEANDKNISEFQLYSRLKSLREENGKIEILRPADIYHLLPENEADRVSEAKQSYYKKPKEINSIDDIFGKTASIFWGITMKGYLILNTPQKITTGQMPTLLLDENHARILINMSKSYSKYNKTWLQVNVNSLISNKGI